MTLPDPEVVPLKSVLIFHHEGVLEDDQREHMMRYLDEQHIMAFLVGPGESVEKLDEDDMYEHGWVRRLDALSEVEQQMREERLASQIHNAAIRSRGRR
jgi:hypothetical protein